jgi:hypothetical protein
MMASITKKELAAKMLISSSKLAILLNKLWFAEITELGYRKHDHIISPRIYEFIQKIWGFDDENC